ncbi:flagellar hook-basal body complex protein [Falsiroseomonas tokyonensis]|uniref:Flagellar hook-basal body complex protein n=1 Tax=Falsiroseomonas tokyonensis TaxID=430521 RepID=A0ABV7BPY6_9PROT|nr:flagellar hook-basal body complex protein [Falsiroseomonas tokyonensis]MBU8537663.1 flagellar hook-basal body complex protein [Falsiroseomonas tokyonensis]
MDSPGYIVLSRLVAQTRAATVTANNIANADTPGFRAARPLFGTVLERQLDAQVPSGGRDLAFAQDRATWRDTMPGAVATTGNPLDLALGTPEGFFAVETPRGERFTRSGRFSLNGDGQVVTAEGFAVLNTDRQPIRVAQGDSRIEVMGDGTLRTENGPVGRLRVVRFADPQQLNAEGDRLYAAPASQQPEAVDRPGVVQGAMEGSNVRPVIELTRMTEEMREFQFVAQMAEKEGERLGSAVDRILRRR